MTEKLQGKFRGTGVAIVTPFTKSGAIDFLAFEKILNHVISNGVEYIVLLGTTGESVTVSKLERKTLIEFAVERIDSRVPLVLGFGGNNTSELVLSIHNTQFKGIDAILSVCPYYNKPTQEGIYQHFKNVAEACPVPVILYTVPGRTSSNIAASTTLKLANDFRNIIGIKEASGNFDQIFQVLKNRPEDFLVISGDDALTLPLLSAGADGVISVVANAFPGKFSEMVRLGLANDFTAARKIHFELLDLTNALFLDGSPGGIKAALNLMGFCEEILRLPLVPVNKEVHKLIKKLIDQIN
ncbi:MAG: 4-hydroxy-tetrahydrodipicolinate synthase [Bacteroidetes bacterium]|nr:4-hydroxy-tetrahydrodipicolinate synthase [Bacteroidota bacterium]